MKLISRKIASSEGTLPLGKLLVQHKIISPDQLQVAVLEEKKTKKSFQKTLLDLGFVTERVLSDFLSHLNGISQIDLRHTLLDERCLSLISKDLALKHKAIPVCLKEEVLHLAMEDPTDILALDTLRHHLPKYLEINPLFSTGSSVLETIQRSYGQSLSIQDILKEMEDVSSETLENPTVRLLNAFILEAVQRNASDIHFEPEPSFVRVRYRIDGVLKQEVAFHGDYWSALCVRLKILSNMNIAETRNPQDGRFSLYLEGRDVDFRVSSHPTIHGENMVVRILDKTYSLKPLEILGFPMEMVIHMKQCLQRPQGLIILTGPTGSGKTTTLYSLLNHISSLDVNIMTLEQPIEYELPLIRQTEIREDSGMTFAEGVRSILRQDPDIIFIGEIRDKETAQMALQAAMTGHQVYTTLHTNTTLGALQRLEDLGVPLSLLGGNLICLFSQRLVRRLCDHCKAPRNLKPWEKTFFGNAILFKAIGCPACEDTGYRGRLPLGELVECSDAFNHLVREKSCLKMLEAEARKRGFVSLRERAIQALLSEQTTLEEILKVVTLEEIS